MNTRYALLFTAVTALLCAVVSAPCQTLSDQAKAQLTKGEQLLSAAVYDQAAVELEKVINDYPQTEWTHWARVRLSECYYHQKRFEDAILEARKVVNLYPLEVPQVAAAWAQFYVGLAYKESKNLDAALWEFQRVEQVLGDNPDRGPAIYAKVKLALTYHELNDRRNAIAAAKELLADPACGDDERAWALVVLGSALTGEKQMRAGLAMLQEVKDKYPGLQEQLLAAEKRIFEYKYVGPHDYGGAVKEARAIAQDPAASEARVRQAMYYIALSRLYKREYDAAITAAQAFVDKYPAPAEDFRACLMIKARAQAMRKDYVRAIGTLVALLATDPPDLEFRAAAEWGIATCCRAVGDKPGADTRYKRLVNSYSHSHLSARAARELAK